MRIDSRDDLYIGKLNRENIPSADQVQGLNREPVSHVRDEAEKTKQVISEEVVKTPRRDSSINDIKVSLGNRDSSLIGLSGLGGIQSSVMRKAVSDMQKDSVLHEYQYFVGSGAVNNRVIMNDDDGVVIRK